MQRSDNSHDAVVAHRQMKASTTLNRKYVQRPVLKEAAPVAIKRSPRLSHFYTPSVNENRVAESGDLAVTAHPLQQSAKEKMRMRQQDITKPQSHQMTARELKEQAIKKALAEAAKTNDVKSLSSQIAPAKNHSNSKMHFSFAHILLALSCAAAVVFAIVYFVNLNMPDISLKVAAMQSGIEASYPGYIPRNFALSSITSENGKIVLDFDNNSDGTKFTLTEEQSHWDSNALLSNYVRPEYSDNYTAVREQGLTIYISKSDAAWVNGGVVYKINTTSGSLTKKQICSIATSL